MSLDSLLMGGGGFAPSAGVENVALSFTEAANGNGWHVVCNLNFACVVSSIFAFINANTHLELRVTRDGQVLDTMAYNNISGTPSYGSYVGNPDKMWQSSNNYLHMGTTPLIAAKQSLKVEVRKLSGSASATNTCNVAYTKGQFE